VGIVGDVDFCALTVTDLDTATAAGGSCAACGSFTGLAGGCADACPACVNALANYLDACALSFVALNYGALEAYTGLLNSSSDCFDWFSLATRPYAATSCGDAFDHVVQYVQSAAMHTVVVAKGVMTTPYSCLQATPATCPAECQADLDLLAGACHAEDAVRWVGNGVPGALNAVGTPAGTFVTPLQAFQLFLNGTASVSTNLQNGVSSAAPLPLNLAACTGVTDGVYTMYRPPPPSPPLPSPPPSPPLPPPSPPSPRCAGACVQVTACNCLACLTKYA
jgi:hypothetical protein